jgi:hypothetical protein
MSFEYHGAFKAMDFLRDNGAPTDQIEAVSEAIIRHADLGETGTLTSLGMLIQLSTVFGKSHSLSVLSQSNAFALPGPAWTMISTFAPQSDGCTARKRILFCFRSINDRRKGPVVWWRYTNRYTDHTANDTHFTQKIYNVTAHLSKITKPGFRAGEDSYAQASRTAKSSHMHYPRTPFRKRNM